MKIQSLVRDQESLVPVEVEISLLPGLPQIQFLGLPDQIIRESVHRIRSAIKWQGFELPRAHQVLVNVRPNHLKKSSRGLELAVATGLLWKTEQVPLPENPSLVVYGELGLEGDVQEPEDLALGYNENQDVLTGAGGPSTAPYSRFLVRELKELSRPEIVEKNLYLNVQRPEETLSMAFPKSQARLLEIIALGEHSALMAGPSGSGKTTLAKASEGFLRAPNLDEIRNIRSSLQNSLLSWRPLVKPHHSSTPLALIGGGVPPRRGEMARAHLGILLLDELLEFHPQVQEALREPMEEGKIRLSRSQHAVEYPAQALVLATTNLCPCGDWVPKTSIRCSRTLQKCRSYLNRLSGPVADRFQILFFTSKKRESEVVLGHEILKRVEAAREFQRLQGRNSLVPNSRLGRDELVAKMDAFTLKYLMPMESASRRRELATLRVARSIADLDRSESVEKQHLNEALELCWKSFERLKALD